MIYKNISLLKKKDFFVRKDINNIYRRNNSVKITEKGIHQYLLSLLITGQTNKLLETFEKYRKNIDINRQNKEGNTLLISSVKEGNIIIVRHLCERFADVNIKNNKGNTALHYAIRYKYFKIADILNNYGAREDILNIHGHSPWDVSY